jgi:CheY-like chemotaxis protein
MNQLSTLLLVDPDPRGLETLTYGFEREGCTVAGTSDPALAGDLLRTTAPQLAVVSLRSPERSVLDVITGIKRGAPVRRVPIVAVGDPSLKQAALAAGTNDFVATPLFVRDVVNVSRLLTLSHPVPNAPHPEVEVQARLSEYHGLFYLLRALAVTGRSGIILLSRGNRRAELRVADGAVMAVHIAGLQGLPALHQLLLWEEAALSLKFRSVPKRSNLHLSAQELLDECERFLRDFAHAARDLGAPTSIYVPAPDRDPGTSGLQPSQLGPALRLFDGRRALTEVIEESPFRVFDTLRVVKRLLESGTLVAKSQGAADGPRSMLEQWAVTPDPRGIVGDRRRQSRRLKTVDGAAPAPASAPAPVIVPAVVPSGFAVPTASFVPEAIAAAPASAPIQLTNKKASGEIPARKAVPTPAAISALAEAPTVQVKLDSLPPPASIAPQWAAPVTAQQAPQVVAEAPPRRPTPAPRDALRRTPRPDGMRRTPPPDSMRRTPPPDSLRRTPPPGKHDTGKRATLEAEKLRKVLPATRLTPSTAFDDLEADFFAREADLYKQEDVESFDDLDRNGQYRPKKR